MTNIPGKTVNFSEHVGYSPRDWQRNVHKNRKRWNVIVCHRRAGKTNMAIMELLRGAAKTPDSRFAYIAPYFVQAKSIAWDILKKYSRNIKGVKVNEAELRVDLPNGSRVTLYGADNPDRLRGIALWGVVFDEYSQQPSNIFTEIIRPALSDHEGWAIWIGTPKGQNAFYELFNLATDNMNKGQEDWTSVMLRASESGIINEKELLDARSTMTGEEYDQEYECSFTAAIKGAYYSEEMRKMYNEKRIVSGLYDKLLPVYTFWDLGVSDYTSILFVQIYGNQVRIIDSYQFNGKGLDYYSEVVKAKPYKYEAHYFPHDIEVRELGSGMSRLEIAYKLFGSDKVYKTKNIGIVDGINAVRLSFYKFWMDEENTQDFRNAVSQYTQEWDDKKGMFRDKPKHDWTSHYADALRYLGVTYQELTKKEVYHSSLVLQDYGFDEF